MKVAQNVLTTFIETTNKILQISAFFACGVIVKLYKRIKISKFSITDNN